MCMSVSENHQIWFLLHSYVVNTDYCKNISWSMNCYVKYYTYTVGTKTKGHMRPSQSPCDLTRRSHNWTLRDVLHTSLSLPQFAMSQPASKNDLRLQLLPKSLSKFTSQLKPLDIYMIKQLPSSWTESSYLNEDYTRASYLTYRADIN
jgi:hypothetical protein